MLEVISGRKVSGESHLLDVVRTSINESDQEYYGLKDMIDPQIINQVTNIDLRMFVQLALVCTEEFQSERPFMSEVMKEIENILQIMEMQE
jgi:hypothetical protein